MQTEVLHIGEFVEFESWKNKDNRWGRITEICANDVCVEFYAISEIAGLQYLESAYVPITKVKRINFRTEHLRVGASVEFITEDTLHQEGIVMLVEEQKKIATIKYATSDVIGIKTKHYVQNVPYRQIRLVKQGISETFSNGIKRGDYVEFVCNRGISVIGRVSSVDGGYAQVAYSYYIDDKLGNAKEKVTLDKLTRYLGYRKYEIDKLPEEKQNEIQYNEKIRQGIVTRGNDFSEVSSTQKKDVLFRHQKAGRKLADVYDKFAFFYDTGTGKTVMALDIINDKYLNESAKFLIIAPKAIVRTAWLEDAEKYFPEMRILPLIKSFTESKRQKLLKRWKQPEISLEEIRVEELRNRNKEYVELLADLLYLHGVLHKKGSGEFTEDNRTIEEMAQHYVINAEMFIRNPQAYTTELGVTGIVLDESAILKNYKSRTSITMREVCKKMKYTYLLSGKPAPNTEAEYFSQMKIVDPETFSMSYKQFVDDFFFDGIRSRLEISEEAKETLAKMISGRSLIISKKDCLDLPDTVDVVRLIELPDDVMAEYNRLYCDCLAVIKGMDMSTRYYSSHAKIAVLMKLRQLASGFFMVECAGKNDYREIVDVHEAKMKELLAVLDEIGDEQVIIWCQFRYEIERIAEALEMRGKVVTAYGGTKNIDESIREFKTGKAKYIIAHPKTLKYGVTFTNCQYAIYYSFSYSAEDYDQSHDRNYRLGQNKKCTYIFLQAEDTIDEIMYQKVINKLTNAEFFELLIKDAAMHGIDYSMLKERNAIYVNDYFREPQQETTENLVLYPMKQLEEIGPTTEQIFLLEEYMKCEREVPCKPIPKYERWLDYDKWDFTWDVLEIWPEPMEEDFDETILVSGKSEAEKEIDRIIESVSVNGIGEDDIVTIFEEILSENLDYQEEMLIRYRYGITEEKRTIQQLANLYHISGQAVRNRLEKILQKLRNENEETFVELKKAYFPNET